MVLMKSNDDKLKHGDKAPDFKLKGIDEREHKLMQFSDKKALLIVFMCNHCPYVKPKVQDLIKIQEDYKDVQVVAINSNDAENYPEDSFENMKKFADEYGINFPYLYDESQEVAKAYGAVCTPDPFLFDKDLKLVFHSRINEGGTQEGSNQELYKVIGEFLQTEAITHKENPSTGCSIKWKD